MDRMVVCACTHKMLKHGAKSLGSRQISRVSSSRLISARVPLPASAARTRRPRPAPRLFPPGKIRSCLVARGPARFDEADGLNTGGEITERSPSCYRRSFIYAKLDVCFGGIQISLRGARFNVPVHGD